MYSYWFKVPSPCLNCCILLELNRLVPGACLAMFFSSSRPSPDACPSLQDQDIQWCSPQNKLGSLFACFSTSDKDSPLITVVHIRLRRSAHVGWRRVMQRFTMEVDGGGPAAKRRRTRISSSPLSPLPLTNRSLFLVGVGVCLEPKGMHKYWRWLVYSGPRLYNGTRRVGAEQNQASH